MFAYHNTSRAVKTFYGVSFAPGESKAVPGYINDPCMVRVSMSDVPKSNKQVKKNHEANKKGDK